VSIVRAVAVLGAVALGAAAVVAVASRTPGDVRLQKPAAGASDPSFGARFSNEQVARHGRYRAPGYLAFGLTIVVEVAALIVLARGPMARAAGWIESLPGGLPVHALAAGAVVAVVLFAALLPLSFVRGFVIQHAWGLSTQDVGGWASDQARSLVVAIVVAAIGAAAFFAVVRWQPRWWWLVGWATFTGLTALMTFVYPILVAPLFNRFTPLEEAPLRARLMALADEAGVAVDNVLVADASRRTTAENAYVAGLGATKRLVLYDTLLDAGGDDETAFVVAHELGHRVENHVFKGVAVASVGLLLSFVALLWLSGRSALWEWAGASGIADLRALPVLVLFATVAGLLLLPAENAVSRAFERRADEIALRLTDDPAAAVRTFRRLAFSNLADLRPPGVAVGMLFTHPPVSERIRAAVAGSNRTQ
jgi:STE24 endopeptidase